MVLVIPVFVRLCATILVRFGRGPVTRIAGRRLEAQPAGVTRLVAALLIGLFLVTGARFGLVVFESTPQYLAAERSLVREQRVTFDVDGRHATAVATRARSVVGVPGSVLRRAQWLESVIPIGVGAVLAVSLGALAGATYLTIDEALGMPWSQTGTLAGVAFLAAATVAAMTVVASAPRVAPDQIRRE